MHKQVVIWLFLIISFFIFPHKIFAVSLNFNGAPSSAASEAFNLNIEIIGARAGNNYLRAEFYKGGTTKYFGETFINGSWIKTCTGNSCCPITISETATSSAILQVRVGSPNEDEYPGQGIYKLKIRRYTSLGGSADDEITPVDINLTYVIPTPIPTPTSNPNDCGGTCGSDSNCKSGLVCYSGYCRNSACNTNTDCVCSTATPTPTPTLTPTSTKTPIPTSIREIQPTISSTSTQEQVLGLRNELNATPVPTPTPNPQSSKSFPFFAVLLILGGGICMGLPVFILLKKGKEGYNEIHEENS